jgi:hypothetical protein
MKSLIYTAFVAGFLSVSTAAFAGEIKGPPPDGNLPDEPSISNGLSRCSFSGLNDTPDGLPIAGDPGGQVQSYGYFMSQFGIFDPSDPDEREGFAFPAEGCNPQHTGGTR